MPKARSETWGAGDQSWLGSAHAIGNCRTETLDVSALTALTDYPDGYVPSGTPLTKSGDLAVPYTGTGDLIGFLFTDQPVVGTADFAVPVLDHGRVKVDRLPVGVTAPDAADDKTTVVYI